MKPRFELPILYRMTKGELPVSKGAMILYVPEEITLEDIAYMEKLLKMQLKAYRRAVEKQAPAASHLQGDK